MTRLLAVDARQYFRDIVDQIRSPAFAMDSDLLALGTRALRSLEAREGEDIDEWVRKLGEQADDLYIFGRIHT